MTTQADLAWGPLNLPETFEKTRGVGQRFYKGGGPVSSVYRRSTVVPSGGGWKASTGSPVPNGATPGPGVVPSLVFLDSIHGLARSFHSVLFSGEALHQRIREGAIQLFSKSFILPAQLFILLGELFVLLVPLISLQETVTIEEPNPGEKRHEYPSEEPAAKMFLRGRHYEQALTG